MSAAYTVYGSPGYGSTIAEGALALLGLPFVSVQASPHGGPEEQELLARVSPLKQTPLMVTPDGRTMTESAAILIWLGDLHPDKGLAPPPDAPERMDYLRWTVFVPAAIYPMYLLKDDPTVWLTDADAQDELRERAIERIKTCWKVMEAAVEPAPWILGERFSLLDFYVTVVSRWTPRRRWFREACPRLSAVVERVDALPQLQAFWAERYPFDDGWEG